MLATCARATVLLCLAIVGAGLLRRSSAATRHLVWLASLVGLLALPLLSAVAPPLRIGVPTPDWAHIDAVGPVPAALPVAPASNVPLGPTRRGPPTARHVEKHSAAPAPAATRVSDASVGSWSGASGSDRADGISTPDALDHPATQSAGASQLERVAGGVLASAARIQGRVAPRGSPVMPLVWLLWLIGVGAVSARVALGLGRVARILRRARPVVDPEWLRLVERASRQVDLHRPVALKMGSIGAVPVTCGIVHPVILLPADAESWDSERRMLVLTHELGHVRRLDVLTHLIGQLAVAIFWFHPLAWFAAGKMRMERERACDDLVLAAGCRPSRYARDLLELVATLDRSEAPAVAALAMARPTEIEGRLVAILDSRARRHAAGPRRILATVAIATAVVVSVGAVRAVPAGAAPLSSRATVDPITRLASTAANAALPRHRVHVRLIAGPHEKPWLVLASAASTAGTLGNDADKRDLLIQIARLYCGHAQLRRAFFDAAARVSSSPERRRVLLGLLASTDGHDVPTIAATLRTARGMAADADKVRVLRTVAGVDPLTDPEVQREFFATTATVSSLPDRTSVLIAVLGELRARSTRRVSHRSTELARLTTAAAETLDSTGRSRVLHAAAGLVGVGGLS